VGAGLHRRSNRSIRTVAIRRATGVLTAIHMKEGLPSLAGSQSPSDNRVIGFSSRRGRGERQRPGAHAKVGGPTAIRLDTLLVRSLLTVDVGRRVWWPSALAWKAA
jgi:hypothetical protein